MFRSCPTIATILAAIAFGTDWPRHAQAGDSLLAPSAVPAAQVPQTPPVFTLDYFEHLAVQRHPTLAVAREELEAARGSALQAGLYPNPVVGYTLENVGVLEHPAEFQGGFIQQEIVVGGKLKLSRATAEQVVAQAASQVQAQEYRLLNSVRTAFYELLAEQCRRKAITEEISDTFKKLEEEIAKATGPYKKLLEDNLKSKKECLQGCNPQSPECRTWHFQLNAAERNIKARWLRLAYLVGAPELLKSCPAVVGDLCKPFASPTKECSLNHLLTASPELQYAVAEVARAQLALKREKREPIPNVVVNATTGHLYEDRRQATSIEAAIVLPLFNRNQGNIRKAQAELARAHAEVARVELALHTRFEGVWASYEAALKDACCCPCATCCPDKLPTSKLVAREAEIKVDGNDAKIQFRRAPSGRQATGKESGADLLVVATPDEEMDESCLDNVLRLRKAEIVLHGLLLVEESDPTLEELTSPGEAREALVTRTPLRAPTRSGVRQFRRVPILTTPSRIQVPSR